MAKDNRVQTGVNSYIRGRAYDQILLHYYVKPWQVPEPQSDYHMITVGHVGSNAANLIHALTDLNGGKMVNAPGTVSGGQQITDLNNNPDHEPCTDWNGRPIEGCEKGATVGAVKIPIPDWTSDPDGYDPLAVGAVMIQYLFDYKAVDDFYNLPPEDRIGITIPPKLLDYDYEDCWKLILIDGTECECVDVGMVSEQIRFNLHETYEYEFRKRVYLVPTKWRTRGLVTTSSGKQARYYFDDPFFPLSVQLGSNYDQPIVDGYTEHCKWSPFTDKGGRPTDIRNNQGLSSATARYGIRWSDSNTFTTLQPRVVDDEELGSGARLQCYDRHGNAIDPGEIANKEDQIDTTGGESYLLDRLGKDDDDSIAALKFGRIKLVHFIKKERYIPDDDTGDMTFELNGVGDGIDKTLKPYSINGKGGKGAVFTEHFNQDIYSNGILMAYANQAKNWITCYRVDGKEFPSYNWHHTSCELVSHIPNPLEKYGDYVFDKDLPPNSLDLKTLDQFRAQYPAYGYLNNLVDNDRADSDELDFKADNETNIFGKYYWFNDMFAPVHWESALFWREHWDTLGRQSEVNNYGVGGFWNGYLPSHNSVVTGSLSGYAVDREVCNQANFLRSRIDQSNDGNHSITGANGAIIIDGTRYDPNTFQPI